MRRRWPLYSFLGVSLLLAAGFEFLGNFKPVPDEDGRTAIPMLREPPPQPPRPGPVSMEPLTPSDVTFRVSFRWLGTVPKAAELDAQLRASAALHLPDFKIQQRPPRSWTRTFRRAPLVDAPGLEIAHVQLPMDREVSHYETRTTEYAGPLTSGQRATGEDVVAFSRDLFIVDFHLRGDEVVKRLRDVDAFIIDFAEKTQARVKSDERLRQATAEEIRERRMNRWVDSVPFGPSYAALIELRADNGVHVLGTEQAQVLGLPDLWVAVPQCGMNSGARHLLIAAVLQRFVENPVLDEPGFINLDVRALKHPDLAQWATAALPPAASGRLRLRVSDAGVKDRRIILLRPVGAAAAACAFAGCELSATFAE